MNTYSQHALRRFANSVNTALTMPLPCSAQQALAATLAKLDQARLAADAACLLLEPAATITPSPVAEPVSVAVATTDPVTPTPDTATAQSIVPITTPQSIDPLEVVETVAADQVVTTAVVAEVVIEIAPVTPATTDTETMTAAPPAMPVSAVAQSSVASSARAVSRVHAQLSGSATAYFKQLPWSGVTDELHTDQDVEIALTMTSAPSLSRNALPATRFFESLCWSSSSRNVAISAGSDAAGGTVVPELLLGSQPQRMAIPIQQFFNQIPWSGSRAV